MWQTETGGPVFGNPYGLGLLPIKPGLGRHPAPGLGRRRRGRRRASRARRGEKGVMIVRRPFPSLTPTIWNDPERYARDYWGRIPGVYFTGDAARLDEDGYFWFSGRADEIIKIAGHRIGTVEVETALLRHPAVAEAGVTGRPDELRGEVISAFVVLRPATSRRRRSSGSCSPPCARSSAPLAVIGELIIVGSLPKTRSGKIMRRVLQAVVSGRDPGDISTIEDEGSVEDAREAMEALVAQVGRPTARPRA